MENYEQANLNLPVKITRSRPLFVQKAKGFNTTDTTKSPVKVSVKSWAYDYLCELKGKKISRHQFYRVINEILKGNPSYNDLLEADDILNRRLLERYVKTKNAFPRAIYSQSICAAVNAVHSELQEKYCEGNYIYDSVNHKHNFYDSVNQVYTVSEPKIPSQAVFEILLLITDDRVSTASIYKWFACMEIPFKAVKGQHYDLEKISPVFFAAFSYAYRHGISSPYLYLGGILEDPN